MGTCKYCGQEIDKDKEACVECEEKQAELKKDIKCPYCGQNPYSAFGTLWLGTKCTKCSKTLPEELENGDYPEIESDNNGNQYEKMNIVRRAFTIFAKPGKYFEMMPKDESIDRALIFGFMMMLVNVVMSIFWSFLTKHDMALLTLIKGLREGFFQVLMFFIIFIQSYFLAGVFKLLGRQKWDYKNTVKVILYSSAINIISWYPSLTGAAGLLGIFIVIVGMSKIHGMSKWKSAGLIGVYLLAIFGIVFSGVMWIKSLTGSGS